MKRQISFTFCLLVLFLGLQRPTFSQNRPEKPAVPGSAIPNGAIPGSNAPKSSVKQPPAPTFEQLMAQAKRFKAAGQFRKAQSALYDAQELNWSDPHPAYMLGWIAIAQKNNSSAIYNFRDALRSGLQGKEAAEARAALKRLGVSEQFPKTKRRPRSLAAQFRTMMLMADLLKPTAAAWAVQTAATLAVAAVFWGVTALLMSWASRQKFGVFDLKYIAFWCLTLLMLRAAGQFWISFRHVFPLVLAYMAIGIGHFLAALFYGIRRVSSKKEMDKGGIVAWGSFYSLFFLLITGGRSFLAPYFLALALAGAALWFALNSWYVPVQRAAKLKKKGDIAGAVALLEKVAAKPRLSAKSRFAILNDLSSNYAALHQSGLAIERANEALNYVHAFKSAEVLPRINMAESFLALGRNDDAVDQLSLIWNLTETSDCLMGNAQWKGCVHGVLAELNYWRGWIDEAEHQADLCLEAFPAELRATPTSKNMVALSRTIKGAARLAMGDLETARKYVEAAPKIGPTHGTLAFARFVASQVHEASGEIETAKELALSALEASPGFFPAELQLADLTARTNKTQAIALLQDPLKRNQTNRLAPLAAQKIREWGGIPPELLPTSTSRPSLQMNDTAFQTDTQTVTI